MKNIIILGATGSIGSQTLDVIKYHPDRFQLVAMTVNHNLNKGIELIRQFKPQFIGVKNEEDAKIIRSLFPMIQIGIGQQGLVEAATFESENPYPTLVVTAVVGSVGLTPTLAAIEKGYDIALANKETLVTAGHLVMDLAKSRGVFILPVDSEHCAIFQCLNGENKQEVKELIITASGGSFRDKTRDQLIGVTVREALNHPNWSMGAKITIDSATMMNKGLEVIEAHWLFGLPYDQITTLLHKESVIHSMVEFVDTSVMAQLGTPDMRMPIQYVLNYPNRIELMKSERLNLAKIGSLNFKAMDVNRYPLIGYAYEAGKKGGSFPTVLNAANEAAVALFLNEKIDFLSIEKIIYDQLTQHQGINHPSLEEVLALDQSVKQAVMTSFNSKGA
jgi:1-deoxy-D-xylulose-5-phosphate reductoisomerase